MTSCFRDVFRNHPAHIPAWTTADDKAARRAWARRAAQSMKLGDLLTGEAHAMQARGYDATAQLPEQGHHALNPYSLTFFPGSPNQVPPAQDGEEARLVIRQPEELAAGYICQISFLDASRQRIDLTFHSLHLDNQVVYHWLHAFYGLALAAHTLPLPDATSVAA